MIKFDLDGTLVDIMAMTDIILSLSDYTRVSPQPMYQIATDPPMDNKQLWEIFFRVYRHWDETPIYPGVTDLMRKIYHATGDPVQIITARPPGGAKSAFQICNKLMDGVPYSIALVDSGSDKYMHLNPDDILVEDRRRTILELTRIGIRSIVIDKEYNKIEDEYLYPEILDRVDSVMEIIPMLDDLL